MRRGPHEALLVTEQTVRRHTPRWRTIFEVGSTLVMVALGSALVWQGRARFFDSPAAGSAPRDLPVPADPIQIGGSAIVGVATARVAIVEYSDFECPACGEFARDFKPALLREYVEKGRAVLVFKNFPLPRHSRAPGAAEAAWCAARQGQFWEMHDRLFTLPVKLSDADLQAAAGEVGLDLAAYRSCRAGSEAAQHVQADASEAFALRVPATPMFYFGRVTPDRRVRVSDAMAGARSMKAFRAVLDRLLK